MEVFVTGGAGLIGRAVAIHLLERGYQVRLSDIVAETDVPYTRYQQCDIMDFEALLEAMTGVDAVVHLAAIRNPMQASSQDVFRVNTVGSFNVFEAAAKLGIKRVVQASSINAIGLTWNTGDFVPQYLPIDEDHIQITSDSYSLSKQHVESLGEYFWRRDRISGVSLRLPGVYTLERRESQEGRERRQRMREFLDNFLLLPENTQREQLAEARRVCLTHRLERNLEYPHGKWSVPKVEGVDELLVSAYTFDRYNLWANIDERDAARAFEMAVSAQYEGSHALFVNDNHNFLGYNSVRLARLFFPDVPADLQGDEAFVSNKRAQRLIGFEPKYSLYGAKHD